MSSRAPDRFLQLALGAGASSSLVIIGLTDQYNAVVAATLTSSSKWVAGQALGDGTTFSRLAVGVGNRGYLQVVGVRTDTSAPYLAAWQTDTGWQGSDEIKSVGGPLAELVALPAQTTSGALQLLAVDPLGVPYQTAWLDISGDWWAGAPLRAPAPGGFFGVTAALGNGGASPQLFGVGRTDGAVYLIAYQPQDGAWTAGQRFTTGPNRAGSVLAAPSSDGNLYLFAARGDDGDVEMVAWQDGGGGWHAPEPIPTPPGTFGALAAGAGPSGLELFGIERASGRPYLIARRSSQRDAWEVGDALPAPRVRFRSLVVAGGPKDTQRVFGLDAEGEAYLVATQGAGGRWRAGKRLADAVQGGAS